MGFGERSPDDEPGTDVATGRGFDDELSVLASEGDSRKLGFGRDLGPLCLLYTSRCV